MEITDNTETLKNALKEIESLRQQLAAEKAKKDIDLVNDPAAWDRLDKALKEIESLQKQNDQLKAVVQEQSALEIRCGGLLDKDAMLEDKDKEIKSLRSELDRAHQNLDGARQIAEKQEKQIESLRSTLEQVTRTLAACCNARDIVVDQRDEWKRRAELMHYWLITGTCEHKHQENFWLEFIEHGPEAAQWYEED